ncbi:glycosyltransferase [Daejeonella lutea]|uniref:Glycosyltransferase involved in cell wall bisynthesis n=1 Tax=Daejeonella lutea TaxID=572036 RepID=A0A1T5EF15_9SPHI|nr:glycosyltransferase [Daejeonella lutea]SKB82428.1 Glycosyltransferase involved in cell wall bisynthesis [Daejeonella lutea]
MPDYTIKNRDIVIVGLQPWDVDLGSNCKNLAIEFSKSNRVLYVNSPLDRKTYWTKSNDPKVKKRINVIRGREKGLRKVDTNIWELYPDSMIESINWIKIPWVFDWLNKRNNLIISNSIRKAVQELNFEQIVLFNDNDIFRSFYLKDFLNPSCSVYYSRDFLLGVDYWAKHGKRIEPKLIAKSDLCVANSVFLARYCQQFNGNSFYVGQGCDFSIFNPKSAQVIPAELRSLAGQIVGYVGALQSIRIDISIIEHLATCRPDWTIVLVGPEDETFKQSMLHSYKNILFTGPKPMELLPSYINAFAVCLNPQLVNQVTQGNYPRKIDEYLAMGKPVVATRTEAMQIFSNYTYLAENAIEYVELIDKALNDDSEELQISRRQFALTHTWENSANEIYNAINKTTAK